MKKINTDSVGYKRFRTMVAGLSGFGSQFLVYSALSEPMIRIFGKGKIATILRIFGSIPILTATGMLADNEMENVIDSCAVVYNSLVDGDISGKDLVDVWTTGDFAGERIADIPQENTALDYKDSSADRPKKSQAEIAAMLGLEDTPVRPIESKYLTPTEENELVNDIVADYKLLEFDSEEDAKDAYSAFAYRMNQYRYYTIEMLIEDELMAGKLEEIPEFMHNDDISREIVQKYGWTENDIAPGIDKIHEKLYVLDGYNYHDISAFLTIAQMPRYYENEEN